jgi:hypothetical protein
MANEKSTTELVIDVLGTIATFLAILIGVWQFNKQQENNVIQEQENKKYNDAIEFKRKNWESQQGIYLSITESVGIIASEYSSKKERDAAISKFKALYYGKAAFVEDSTVATTMRSFSQDIQDFKGGFLTENDLKVRALDLIKVCKTSSYKSWHVLSTP